MVLLFLHFSFTGQSQILEFYYQGNVVQQIEQVNTLDAQDHLYFSMVNTSSDTIEYQTWFFQNSTPEEWYTYYIDPILSWEIDSDLFAIPYSNSIAPNDTVDLQINTNLYTVEGCTHNEIWYVDEFGIAYGKIEIRVTSTQSYCFLNQADVIQDNFAVYPNPSSGLLNIEAFNFDNEVKLTIFDNSGRTVFTEKINPGLQSFSIDHLKTGIYVYSIETHQGIIKKNKLIIQ